MISCKHTPWKAKVDDESWRFTKSSPENFIIAYFRKCLCKGSEKSIHKVKSLKILLNITQEIVARHTFLCSLDLCPSKKDLHHGEEIKMFPKELFSYHLNIDHHAH